MVLIRKYQPSDRNKVIDICWRTGYMGEEAKGRFDDPYLFGLLFCIYYLDYEPDNCFVAVDDESKVVVGYILSSFDSKKQEKRFRQLMTPKILRRVFLYTMWRRPKTFKTLLYFRKNEKKSPPIPNEKELLSPYPAHLHIDILPEWHNKGIGRRLIHILESHLSSSGILGVHLGTTDYNIKAIPFYTKVGFSLIYEGPSGHGMWPDAPEAKPLIFAKKIKCDM
ncbi:MAG: GNAT family N-acetyltransferase [Candidatus Hodarchaeota archaeon]